MEETVFDGILRKRLKYLEEGARIPDGVPLKELGLDSMQAVDLLLDLEDELGVVLPDEAMTAETFATRTSLMAAVATARATVVSMA